MFQEQLLGYKYIYLYLVCFTRKSDPSDIFYKIGITGQKNIMERFTDPIYEDQYLPWDIKIITYAYGPPAMVLKAEDKLHEMFPKNFHLPEKIKGVLEIIKPVNNQLSRMIKGVNILRDYWISTGIPLPEQSLVNPDQVVEVFSC